MTRKENFKDGWLKKKSPRVQLCDKDFEYHRNGKRTQGKKQMSGIITEIILKHQKEKHLTDKNQNFNEHT